MLIRKVNTTLSLLKKIKKFVNCGIKLKKKVTLKKSTTPAQTKVAECIRADAGNGASIASSNQI